VQVLTVRATDQIVEAVERVVVKVNKGKGLVHWDPKEVGRSAVLRHLIALGLEAFDSESERRMPR